MDIQQFWRLIDTARAQVAGSAHTEAVAARAAMLLSALPPEEIIAAQRVLSGLLAESYQTLLWAAGTSPGGGISRPLAKKSHLKRSRYGTRTRSCKTTGTLTIGTRWRGVFPG
jgi:Protein of unknown function (DUF4240)